jgi:A/G-specific adenine glycosylase
MMELGAVVCVPGKPVCHACPVIELCASRGAGIQRERATRRKAILKYSLCRKNGSVLLQQRDQSHALMPGMWELPMFHEKTSAGTQPAAQPLMKLKHSITTTDYSVLVFAGNARKGQWVPLCNAERFALTGLTRKILRKLAEKEYAGPLSVELFLPKFQQGDPFEIAREIRQKSEAVMRQARVI